MFKKQVSRILGLAAVIAGTAGAEEYSRERYEVIVSRSPFGREDLAGVAAVGAPQNAAAARAAERELRLCFLFETAGGESRAGFENKTAKSGDPKSLSLKIGESFRGMKLLDIDLNGGRATMDRNGTRVVFELMKAAGGAIKSAAPPAAKRPAVPQRRFGGGFKRRTPPQPTTPPKPAQPVLSPEEEAIKREEVRKNLQEYQMEVIRKGMPPLPVPLTQEMDDQLVSEGVLPPSE